MPASRSRIRSATSACAPSSARRAKTPSPRSASSTRAGRPLLRRQLRSTTPPTICCAPNQNPSPLPNRKPESAAPDGSVLRCVSARQSLRKERRLAWPCRGPKRLRYLGFEVIVYSMQQPRLARANISAAAAAAVRAMIVDGRLADGERINEVRLAEQLGVSRTPLREALSRLSAEGAITSSPHLGYFVRALTLEEFQQVYAIRPLLDPEALRLAGLPSAKKIERLERANDVLRKEHDVEA